MKQKYYALETSNQKADLYIFGSITSYPWREKDKDAYGIVKEISELDVDEIHVHINSTGGSIAEGLSIYNVLKDCKSKIVTYCTGFACSAASVVFMAGDERVMHEASLLMIHNAWTYGSGNANAFRKQADDLDKITQASVKAYMRHVNLSEDELKKMMDEETWISADDAKSYGFATKVLEEKEEDVSQSAMASIKEKLLCNSLTAVKETTTFDAKAVAKEILAELKEANKPKTEESAWALFFNTKKGE